MSYEWNRSHKFVAEYTAQFLGAEHYQPSLDAIHKGLGVEKLSDKTDKITIPPGDYYKQFKQLNDIFASAKSGKAVDLIWGPEGDLTEYHKYKPGDKARVTRDGTWVDLLGQSYTVKAGEIIVIADASILADYYGFHHVEMKFPGLIGAKDLKPVSFDTPHICYCPRETVIHHGCKCKGI